MSVTKANPSCHLPYRKLTSEVISTANWIIFLKVKNLQNMAKIERFFTKPEIQKKKEFPGLTGN